VANIQYQLGIHSEVYMVNNVYYLLIIYGFGGQGKSERIKPGPLADCQLTTGAHEDQPDSGFG
jgi:hypothetical protein